MAGIQMLDGTERASNGPRVASLPGLPRWLAGLLWPAGPAGLLGLPTGTAGCSIAAGVLAGGFAARRRAGSNS